MPPLRELAPQPMVCASKTATDAPDFARVLAAERPVKPAPIMAASTCWGKSRAAGLGISTVSSQKVFSCIEIHVQLCRATLAEPAVEEERLAALAGAH